ncbi:sulfurtransferase [Agromyces sp. MMS24-K17]|uniref:sulfurtransferase n=1 Tax=Agromyces sp. MMS24-K17 TaxID=3372850 RepID=UPI003754D7B6
MTALVPPADLVSSAWLADHLGDPRLVVLDATVVGSETAAGFRWLSGLDAHLVDGHVTGAVHADLLEEFSEPGTGPLVFTRPDLDRLARAAREVGIDDTTTVVVYDTAVGQWAARLWWLLRSAGFARVALLDGGLGAWRAAGGEVRTGYEPPREAGPLTLAGAEQYWADRDEVRRIVDGDAPGSLVCAAPASDFRGETGRRERKGHIPGSVSVPVVAVLDRDDRTYLRDDALEGALVPVADGGRVVVYCGAGIAAAATGFALRLAGRTDVAVYDGSLDEWAADPAAPIVSLA